MSGPAVATDMVSPVEHEVECKVESKNLVDESSRETAGTSVYWNRTNGGISLKSGQTYILSTDGATAGLYIGLYGTRETLASDESGRNPKILTYTPTNDVIVNVSTYSISAPYTGNIQLEKGSVATPYTPYVPDLSKVTVSRYGKNIFGGEAFKNKLLELDPKAVVDEEKSLITIESKAVYQKNIFNFPSGDLYTLIFFGQNEKGNNKDANLTLKFKDGTTKNLVFEENADLSYSILEVDKVESLIGGYMTSFTTFDYSKCGIFLGRVNKVDYKPYIEPTTYTPTPDGTVEGMTSLSPNMTILSDNPNVTINATYNVDTKTYIDRKFNELKLAILSRGGNV